MLPSLQQNYQKTQDQLLFDVQRHLTQLLNTRQGSLSYLPDYGLPDLQEIYQTLPRSIGRLIQAIERVICKYEPRIKKITVLSHAVQHTEHVIELDLALQLVSKESLFLKTQFMSNGLAEVTAAV